MTACLNGGEKHDGEGHKRGISLAINVSVTA